MIARTTAIPAAAYRVGHERLAVLPVSRRAWNNTWLLLAIVVIGLVATRYARSLGLFGILAPVLGLLLVMAILRIAGPIWLARQRPPAPPPDPRNVTPEDRPTPTGSTIGRSAAPPAVVVIEPATGTNETLEAKLATLDRLRDDGRLTDLEYEAKRAQLIADF
jgi:hypothetical protein